MIFWETASLSKLWNCSGHVLFSILPNFSVLTFSNLFSKIRSFLFFAILRETASPGKPHYNYGLLHFLILRKFRFMCFPCLLHIFKTFTSYGCLLLVSRKSWLEVKMQPGRVGSGGGALQKFFFGLCSRTHRLGGEGLPNIIAFDSFMY